ncbi:MAG: GNAT superfamily N-acetyltransferase [Paraglaciecola sp.]|jgi:GNAT superfamily N-acetyltransferase
MNIRLAEIDDIDTLVNFNQQMAMETEKMHLNNDLLTKGVSRLVEDPNKGFYLVAEQDDQVRGSLMVTTEWSDWRNGVFWWIQSVYVAPDYRRQGIYAKLYAKVKTLAGEAENVCGFRLYVEKENIIAQQTYTTLGMSESHYLMFEES